MESKCFLVARSCTRQAVVGAPVLVTRETRVVLVRRAPSPAQPQQVPAIHRRTRAASMRVTRSTWAEAPALAIQEARALQAPKLAWAATRAAAGRPALLAMA